jgi:hypothetical protein
MEAVGDVPSASGASAEQNKSELSGGGSEAFQRLLKEKKVEAEKRRELEAKLKAIEEKSLLEQNQFRELAEMKAKEAEEYKSKFESEQAKTRQGYLNTVLRDKLLTYGLNPKYTTEALKLIDKSKLQVDPDNSVVIGADETAKEFYNKYAGLFFSTATPGVTHQAPGNTGVSAKAVKDMTRDERNRILAQSILRK